MSAVEPKLEQSGQEKRGEESAAELPALGFSGASNATVNFSEWKN